MKISVRSVAFFPLRAIGLDPGRALINARPSETQRTATDLRCGTPSSTRSIRAGSTANPRSHQATETDAETGSVDDLSARIHRLAHRPSSTRAPKSATRRIARFRRLACNVTRTRDVSHTGHSMSVSASGDRIQVADPAQNGASMAASHHVGLALGDLLSRPLRAHEEAT